MTVYSFPGTFVDKENDLTMILCGEWIPTNQLGDIVAVFSLSYINFCIFVFHLFSFIFVHHVILIFCFLLFCLGFLLYYYYFLFDQRLNLYKSLLYVIITKETVVRFCYEEVCAVNLVILFNLLLALYNKGRQANFWTIGNGEWKKKQANL